MISKVATKKTNGICNFQLIGGKNNNKSYQSKKKAREKERGIEQGIIRVGYSKIADLSFHNISDYIKQIYQVL